MNEDTMSGSYLLCKAFGTCIDLVPWQPVTHMECPRSVDLISGVMLQVCARRCKAGEFPPGAARQRYREEAVAGRPRPW